MTNGEKLRAAADAVKGPIGNNTLDLFGEPVQIRKRHQTKKTGYAFIPGTGPEGKTCADCGWCYRRQGGSKYFYKCGHVRAPQPTGGLGTDIKLKSPACRGFTALPELFMAWARKARYDEDGGRANRVFRHSEPGYGHHFQIIGETIRWCNHRYLSYDQETEDLTEAEAIAKGRELTA